MQWFHAYFTIYFAILFRYIVCKKFYLIRYQIGSKRKFLTNFVLTSGNWQIAFRYSFEQEENEMKMMSCIFDDEGESSSSNSYEHNQHIPENHNQHAKRKLNFIKKKHQNSNNSDVSGGCPKVQRSASAIFRSKVYAVVARKQKKSVTEKQDIKENKGKTLSII